MLKTPAIRCVSVTVKKPIYILLNGKVNPYSTFQRIGPELLLSTRGTLTSPEGRERLSRSIATHTFMLSVKLSAILGPEKVRLAREG